MKKLMLILPIIIGGAVVGLGLMGIIQIPGLSPKKKTQNSLAAYTEKDDKPKVDPAKAASKPDPKKDDPPKPAVIVTKVDATKGRKRLAKLWNTMETAKILEMVKSWKDDELAEMLMALDAEKASAIISELKPERASKVSRLIQKLGSVVDPGA